MFIGFVSSVIMSRLLDPRDFGLVAMIAFTVSISKTIVDGGFSLSLIRTKNVSDEEYSTIFLLNLIIAFLVYLLIYASSGLIASFFSEPELASMIKVYGFNIIISSCSLMQIVMLNQNLNFKRQAYIAIPSILIGALVGVVCALNGYGAWSLIFSLIAQSAAHSFQLWLYKDLRFKISYPKYKYIVHHWKFSSNILLSRLIDNLFTYSINIVIGKLYTARLLGFYQKADSLNNIPIGIVGSVVSRVSFPIYAKLQEQRDKLATMFNQSTAQLFFILVPIFSLLILLSEEIVTIIYGPNWSISGNYLKIISLAGLLYPLHLNYVNVINALGESKLFLRIEIIKKIVYAISIFVGSFYGLYGLLWSLVFISVISYIIHAECIHILLGSSMIEQVKLLLISAIIGLFSYCTVLSIIEKIDEGHVVTFLISILLYIPLYFGISMYLNKENYSSFQRNFKDIYLKLGR